MSVAILQRRELSGPHHVARHCRRRDIADGIVARSAFLLRPGEEYLSTNWLEHFHESDRPTQITGVQRALTDKGFHVRRNAAFAVLNVGITIAACKNVLNLDIQIVELGESHDPSHAGIFGCIAGDADTAATLAQQVREVHLAASSPAHET